MNKKTNLENTLIKMSVLIHAYGEAVKSFFEKKAFRKLIECNKKYCVELELVTHPEKSLQLYLVSMQAFCQSFEHYPQKEKEFEKLEDMLIDKFNQFIERKNQEAMTPEISNVKLILKEDGTNVLKQVDVIQESSTSTMMKDLFLNPGEIHDLFNHLIKKFAELKVLKTTNDHLDHDMLKSIGHDVIKRLDGRYRTEESNIEHVMGDLLLRSDQISLLSPHGDKKIIPSHEVLKLLHERKIPSVTEKSASYLKM